MVDVPSRTAHPVEAILNDVGRYTPSRIGHHLIYWDALTARAERFGSVNVSDDPPSTRTVHSDSMRWADVQGDILTALAHLGIGTPAYSLVQLVMIGRWELTCADFIRPRDWEAYVVREAGRLMRPWLGPIQAGILYADAVRRMAAHLGWRPADE